ncbi:MAG: sugar ABC transporter substrate-binding protein [Oscillospiraceae bacterium]|nr:sugar ABC transporter substrate-binding protein [Oscillospiraceae bacterium]
MKRVLTLFLAVLLVMTMVLSLSACSKSSDEKKSIGFVTFGLGEGFFQMLADTYKSTFEAKGWEASYADGGFNPETQISAAENYISMGVDVLVIWAVAPEAMTGVVKQAMDQGIKVISFVAELPQYDVLMLSDDAMIAGYCAKLAAKWIDETYADAADHSVPVAVLSCRTADTGVLQANVLMEIEKYSKKAKFAGEFEQSDESATTGQTTAENLYTTNPEIKVFLTAHNGLANGVASFYTSMSSPVTDYSDMGIFCINGDDSTAQSIKASVDGKSPLRGTVMTGSVQDTANEILKYVTGVMDGTYKSGHVAYARNLFVYGDTVDEYLKTGDVTSVTETDFAD